MEQLNITEAQLADQIKPVEFKAMEQDRLTIRVSAVHQFKNRKPTIMESATSRFLENREQSYYRDIELDSNEGWIDIDYGWVKNPGTIIIENSTGRGGPVQLSKEELEHVNKHVAYIKASDEASSSFQISPNGAPFMAELHGKPALRIMSGFESVSLTITVIPS